VQCSVHKSSRIGSTVALAAAVSVSATAAVGGCSSGGIEAWEFDRRADVGAPTAPDAGLAEGEVLFRSEGGRTEGLVAGDDTVVEVVDGRLERPAGDRLKPVRGLGEIGGLELVPVHDRTGAEEPPETPRPRVGVVRGTVRERDGRIEVRNPRFRRCETARVFDFEVAPEASDECVYIDGEQVEGSASVSDRSPGGGEPVRITAFFRRTVANSFEEFSCALDIGDDRSVLLPAERKFRIDIDSIPEALFRGEGSVEAECAAGPGWAVPLDLPVERIDGWVAGADGPGVGLVNIALRFEIEEPTSGTDSERAGEFAVWKNVSARSLPFRVE